MVYLMGHLY
ncbi:unnamed protein product [Staurois parvus]|uniref:Uncharacterized protein n=1 Tax=Staurois parvus TaxID=386267 RepID=A0ABN9FEP4_9NEOB|nr:unnamed protein product [Staurois parvus]